MADLVAGLDMSKPPGSRFGPAMIQEIQIVAPSTVNDKDITEPKLDDGAVSTRALGEGQVTESKLDTGAVSSRTIATGAVTDDKIGIGELSPEKVAPGIVTSYDWQGNPVTRRDVTLTSAQYDALDGGPDPSTMYYISG